MQIDIGDKFKTPESVYTVIEVIQKNGKTSVRWDCVGKGLFMKQVSIKSIEEWVRDKRLEKIDQ